MLVVIGHDAIIIGAPKLGTEFINGTMQRGPPKGPSQRGFELASRISEQEPQLFAKVSALMG